MLRTDQRVRAGGGWVAPTIGLFPDAWGNIDSLEPPALGLTINPEKPPYLPEPLLPLNHDRPADPQALRAVSAND